MAGAERDGRIDGLRGVCGIAVVASHYLGEVPSGSTAFAVGWMAVNVFFVMSGFLIGRLVMERAGSANFFLVFYARRLLRTLPSYLVVVAAVVAATSIPAAWVPAFGDVPALAYATFTQNLFMASHATTGTEWLAPTWTLAVEEQFYLLAPLAIVFLPRNALLACCLAAAAMAVALRFAGVAEGGGATWHLLSLAGRADALAIGVAAAAIRRSAVDWARWDRALEIAPLVAVLAAAASPPVLGREVGTQVACHLLVSIAGAAFIVRLTTNPGASPWLSAPFLRSAGHQSYSLYLVHMPVALLLHGTILGAHPDAGSVASLAVTAAAAAATVAVAACLTRWVEDPATALGRRFRWAARGTAPAAARA